MPNDENGLNIAVFNTAADSSGAMSELHRFKAEVESLKRRKIHWHYVLGLAELEESPSATVHRFPWTKRSWFFRLAFDFFKAKALVRDTHADVIVSLQNTTVRGGKTPQLLFVQLCFPFIEHRFPLRELSLWLHQNLIGALSIRSIRRADLVVVQNEWMRKACARKAGVDDTKIRILKQAFVPPAVLERFSPTGSSFGNFFYPATAKSYKNHRLLLDAIKLARQKSSLSPRLTLTVKGDDSDGTAALREQAMADGLEVQFLGAMSRDALFSMYSRSVLVFPSLLETVGLPLVEAKAVGGVILAYDAEYSRDVLRGYSDAHFFTDAASLASLLTASMEGQLAYRGGVEPDTREGEDWSEIIDAFTLQTLERKDI